MDSDRIVPGHCEAGKARQSNLRAMPSRRGLLRFARNDKGTPPAGARDDGDCEAVSAPEIIQR